MTLFLLCQIMLFAKISSVWQICAFLIVIITHLTTVGCNQVYVCPMRQKGDRFMEKILCDKSVDCKFINQMFVATYSRQIVVLYHGKVPFANDTLKTLDNLFNCGIAITFIEVDQNNVTQYSQMCSNDKVVITFTLWKGTLQFFQVLNNVSSCILQDAERFDKTLVNFMSTCPNIAWINGTSACHSNETSKNVHLHYIQMDNRTTNFQSNKTITLKIGTIVDNVWVFNGTRDKNTSTYSGSIMELLHQLSLKLGFKYNIIPSVDGKYGIPDKNGNWDGLIGMLIRKEIDMIASSISITKARYQYIDFTVPFYHEPYGILLHKQSSLAVNWWAMVETFSYESWIAIMLSTIAAIFVVHIIHYYSANRVGSEFEKISECIWYIYSGLVNQGGEIPPRSWSSQNFLTFWWLFVLAIISIYSGVLVSQLSFGRIALPFNDIPSLVAAVKSGKFELCIAESTSLHGDILSREEEAYKLLKEVITKYPQSIKSNDNCTHNVVEDSRVVFITTITRESAIQKKNCLSTPMVILPDDFRSDYVALALPKGSPLRDIISIQVAEIVDHGLFLMSKAFTDNKDNTFCEIPSPTETTSNVNSPMALDDFYAVFIALFIGLVFSFLTLCFEIARYNQ